jgi:stage III sporulation protein AH
MVMTNKKKIIVMSGLVLLLAVTAVFNFVLAGATTTQETGTVTVSNYFSSYRTERTTTRNEEITQLDSVISLYEAGSEKYESATTMKMELVSAMEQELVLESMIKSLGFSDCVVSLSTSSENINVFINSDELNYDTALQIYNMLKNETGAVSGNIIIMPVYSES